MELPKQFDNISTRVIDDLKTTLQRGSKVSMTAASFSIYAFEALYDELKNIDELRFTFTSPTFNREHSLYGSDFEIRLRNNLTQRAIARECADRIREKVRFKTNLSQLGMPGILNVKNHRGGVEYTYTPFNEFTSTELGCERGNNIFQLIRRLPSPNSDAYLKNRNNAVTIGKQNLLPPFYMVYLSDNDSSIINRLSPKRLLDIMRLSCKGRTEPVKDLCRAFNKETADGRKIQHYSELLHYPHPQNTIVNRVVPKTMFYKFMEVNSRTKARFVNDVTVIGEHKAGTMAEIVALKEQIASAEAEPKNLKRRMRREAQLDRQKHMNAQVKASRKQLDSFKTKLEGLK